MKKGLWKIITVTVIAVVAVAVFLIGYLYFETASDKITEDSAKLLDETYEQVGRSVQTYINQKWRILSDWTDYLGEDFDFEKRKNEWQFEDFYFLAPNEEPASTADISYVKAGDTVENIGHMGLEGAAATLFNESYEVSQRYIMASERINYDKLIIFAIPASGTYRGFEYSAIAISYKNDSVVRALDTKPFSGNANFFVAHKDGSVLFTTNEGGAILFNYLTVLESSMEAEPYAQIKKDWENGKKELTHMHCKISSKEFVNEQDVVKTEVYCILYKSIAGNENQDYMLLCVVPQRIVNEGFLSIQSTTIYVLLIIFSIIGISVLALVIVRSYLRSKQNMTELKYREQMFDVLSSNVDDIFIMIDPETQRVDYLSPNIEHLLGISADIVRKDIREMAKCAVDYNIIVPQEDLNNIPENGNKSWECEYMHQTTGERRWYRVKIYHQNIQGTKKFIVVMSDRTIDRQLNQKLEEAFNAAKSANEAKSNFLSNMSHDIRTPMNAIVGFSVLLEKDADDVEKVRQYTRKIMASSHHLLSLINDVLDMSKIESGKTSLNVDKFSLPELLEELNIIIMPQAKAKNQEFTMRLKGKPPEQILGDKLRLNQILLNLLSNAVKYTPAGGKIEFIMTELESSSQQSVKLRFEIRDNGIGMSEDFIKDVFAPFSREINSVTNKIQGTGLGMAITKNLVDLMGGIISVKSKLGEGSTFTVELSFMLPEADENDSWYEHKVTRMLVADDEEDICLNIKEMMRNTGVDVAIATDGPSAVEKTIYAHELGDDFHVILLDWKMPGMDGVETARRIRKEVGDSVPILVLTSYDWSEIEDEARKAGINAFMPKPFFTSTFWQTIKPLFETTTEAPVSQNTLKEAEESVMNGKLFLIAEDNELNSEILTEMLLIEGAKSELARNGKEAVEMFEASEAGHYDMIFMDVQMPIMNGYEATREIRKSSHPQAKSIPIVAMTANTFAEDVRNALDSGMNGHLAKPINMDIVRETVAKLLGAATDGEDKKERK